MVKIASFFVAALAGAASAATGTKVSLFTDSACTSTNAITLTSNVLASATQCVELPSTPVSVPELGTSYKYARVSDVPNEVLLFPDQTSCQNYPPTFDPNQQVAFIRASNAGQCLPCYRCGNVKSVQFDAVDIQEQPSSASFYGPSAVIISVIVAGLTYAFHH